ncbi:MAG: peroxiredoxin family protein, partial [Candidatus Kapaibacterium sp.]
MPRIITLLILIAFIPLFASAGELVTVTKFHAQTEADVIPDFEWTQDGVTRSFYEVSDNKIVLVYFWGSWCGICTEGLAPLNELHSELDPAKFLIIGIDCEMTPEDRQLGQDIIDEKGLEFLNFFEVFTDDTSGFYELFGEPQ